ncbi:MAG: TonB-dependent receptor, partial [Bryobacteraceae bacterium]
MRTILPALLVCCGPLLAQYGSIQGLVTDTTKAVVPGAQVTVTNTATGVNTTVETNASGLYNAAFVTPGRYNVAAAKQGFAASRRQNLTVDVDETARVDFTLNLGAVATTVDVSGAGSVVDTETSTVGQVIGNKQVVELPLNGRNYLQLAQLTSGTAPANGTRSESQGQISALGQHGLQTNVILDGVDNNSRFSGGQLGYEAQAVTPSIDSVAEFKVVTNNNSAEYGYRMGGTVIVETKSGTNGVHGSAYEFLRNDKLDGANFFAVGQPKPPFKQNQFGGTVGGPVIKNRTFFFGSYEGTRIRQGTSAISTIPTDAERNGNFSAATGVIYDPATTQANGSGGYTRSPFPGNVIPASRFDPVAQKVVNLYPSPNLRGLTNNEFFSGSDQNDTNEVDTRLDHNFTENQRMFVRYSRRDNTQYTPGNLPEPADGATSQTVNLIANSGVVSFNSTLSPSLNNEARVGVTRVDSVLDIPFTTNYNTQLGILGVPNLGSDNQRGMTRFTPTGFSEIGARSFWPNTNNLNVEQFNDTVLWTHDRHIVKMGFSFLRENIYRLATRFARGQMAFDGSFTQDPNNRGKSGNAIADLLLGLASGGTIGNENGENVVSHNYSTFVQDDWKITARLTLNLGLRWDLFEPPSYPDSTVSRLDIFPGSPTYGQFQYPKGGHDCGCQFDYKNFAPRVGFAWQALAKTVVRSGFGMFYGVPDAISQDGNSPFANQAPAFTEISFPTDRLLQPALVVSNGFPTGLLPATVLEPNTAARAAYSYTPTQYAMEWFADVQQELPGDSVLTLSYLGSGTRHLATSLNVNQPLVPGPGSVQSRRPLPFFAGISLATPLGDASYQAAAVKLEKRYTSGLSLLASYTYSHSIDDVGETDSNAQGNGVQNNYDLVRNRGNSTFNI